MMANYYANGRQVRGYHIVNVALHCACSVLVAIVARRVMRITALHACLAATLFAAHPVHTEAVSSIVGRAEVLCCLFFLLSFLCYHRPVYSHCIRDVVYRFISDSDVIVLASLTTLLLCFRLWILQGSFPEFSEMDNPASFSSMRTTSIGVTLLVAEGLHRLHTRCSPALRWCTTSLCFILVLLFAARTWNRNAAWASREALFESGIRDLPGNAKMHYNYANLQKDIGNTDLAIKHYRLAIELWPEHASAHNNLGTVLTSAEESEQHFRYALHVNPSHPGAHFNLANIYSKRGQKEVAKTLLERAVELEPDFCEAYSLAALAAEKGDLTEAERLHRMALSSDDRNADARNNYGTFLQSHGRSEEAVAQYQQALHLQQNHTVALLNAARSLRSMNLNMQAESLYKSLLIRIASYEVAIRLDPDLAHAHLNLAVIRHLESDYPTAFRHYQTALSLDPKNKLILDNMAKLRRRMTRPFHDCV
ncbi:hypothetical protein HPB52_024887 [Rhipicephalus sanguineus]|uniref:Uncharacterized protein n=1 Tax=Rhipicephalus sanguineus TaxID=34632 RepID=A0A9D4TDQ7_RHISA|nr:hypothetical protein HPB52_024887 [Rhipicephalus sanguineus]